MFNGIATTSSKGHTEDGSAMSIKSPGKKFYPKEAVSELQLSKLVYHLINVNMCISTYLMNFLYLRSQQILLT